MSLKTSGALTAGAVCLISANIAAFAAAELKVSGAAAVAGNIVMPNKDAIEKETGLTLNVTANGDGNGLMDLYSGKVDVAMVAAPINLTEAALNKKNPGSISIAGFEVGQVGSIGISFMVNAANPVKSLTAAQIKDILTGKITSWKDVGGDDKPILVVAIAPGFGTRSSIVASFLDGTEITDKARIMQSLVQIGQVVAQAPDAIGYGNAATIKSAGTVTAIPGLEIKQTLGMVTKGAPSADAKKLIEATAKYGALK